MSAAVPGRWRQTLPVVPAALAVAAVLGAALVGAGLQSLGLMPLVGDARLSVAAFDPPGVALGSSVTVTVAVATAATVVAVVVGALTALAVLTGGRVVALAALLTVPVPHLVGATGTGLLLSASGLLARVLGVESGWPPLVGGTWWVATVWEYAWKESACGALVVVAALGTRVRDLTQTAATLGAGRLARLRHVVLPLAAPSLLTSGGIVLIYTMGSYEVPRLLGRPAPEPLAVAAVRLSGSIDLGVRPQAAALAVLTIGLCLVAVVVLTLLLRRLAAWR